MPKIVKPKAAMAVEILYNSIHDLPHPDAGAIKLVQYGHKSDGQKKITRHVAEAIVLKLEANGMHIVNGLSEAEALLTRNGYVVLAPGDEAVTYKRDAGVPTEAPGEPGAKALADTQAAIAAILKDINHD